MRPRKGPFSLTLSLFENEKFPDVDLEIFGEINDGVYFEVDEALLKFGQPAVIHACKSLYLPQAQRPLRSHPFKVDTDLLSDIYASAFQQALSGDSVK